MSLRRFVVLTSCQLLLAVSLNGIVRAADSDVDTDAPLGIHNIANSQELLGEAEGLYEQALATIQGAAESGGRALPKALAQAYGDLRRLRRIAVDLQMHGEPAGSDFAQRAAVLQKQLVEIINRFKATQAGVAHANKTRQFLQTPKAVQARQAVVLKLRQLMQQQKWLEAYKLLYDTTDELASVVAFLGPMDSYLNMFSSFIMSINTNRNRLFREQVLDVLMKAGTAQRPDTTELLRRVSAAASGLRANQTVDVDGKMLTGPACLEHFTGAWKQVHLASLRCRAIDWARRPPLPQTGAPPARDPKWIDEAEYARFCTEHSKALIGFIEADSERAQGQEASQLYMQYLEILPRVVAQTADGDLAAAAEAALEKLAAKSPGFHQQVQAYRSATDELLRWRERTVASAVESRAAEFTSSDELMKQATVSRQEFRGLLDATTPLLENARLIGSVPEVMPVAIREMMDKQVLVRDVVGLPGGALGVARYKSRHYSMVSAYSAADEIQRLKQDLLVTEQLPPLTLAAAAAIDSAGRGDYVAVGGLVRGVHIEGLIPRFAVLPEGGVVMVALGPLPKEPSDNLLLAHVLMRLNVVPTWVAHRYFFSEAPGTGNVTESN